MKKYIFITLLLAITLWAAPSCDKKQIAVEDPKQEQPEEPEKPDQPDQPGTPDTPDQPDTPQNPEQPVITSVFDYTFAVSVMLDGSPYPWKHGDIMYIGVDGQEKNVFKLRYSAREETFEIDTLAGGAKLAFTEDRGPVTAIHADNMYLSFDADGKFSGTLVGNSYIAESGMYHTDGSDVSIELTFKRAAQTIKVSGNGGECIIKGITNKYQGLASLVTLTWKDGLEAETAATAYYRNEDAVTATGAIPANGIISLLFAEKEMEYTRKTSIRGLSSEELLALKGPSSAPTQWQGKETYKRYKTGEYITYCSSKKSNPVNIIITGDGFIADDLRAGGTFEQRGRAVADAIFSVEPYATYKDYFNVYIVAAESKERGADIKTHELYNNKEVVRDTYFDTGWTSRTDYGGMISSTGKNILSEFIKGTPGYNGSRTFTVVLCNEYTYGGLCYWSAVPAYCFVSLCLDTSLRSPRNLSWGGAWDKTTTGTSSGNYLNVVLHELCGHEIARLADEYPNYYSSSSVTTASMYYNHLSDFALNVGVDTWESSMPWADFEEALKANGGGATGLAGLGKYECKEGLYRSDYQGCMADNRMVWGIWNRYLIAQRIHKLVGEQYSYAQFLKEVPVTVTDPVWKVKRIGGQQSSEQTELVPMTAPPVSGE